MDILDEINSFASQYESAEFPSVCDMDDEENDLKHYGTKYHSGRYPWGSGDDPYQHSGDLLSRIDTLKKEGFTEPEIAKALGIVNDNGEPSTTRLRIQKSIATYERRVNAVATAKSLQADGCNYSR